MSPIEVRCIPPNAAGGRGARRHVSVRMLGAGRQAIGDRDKTLKCNGWCYIERCELDAVSAGKRDAFISRARLSGCGAECTVAVQMREAALQHSMPTSIYVYIPQHMFLISNIIVRKSQASRCFAHHHMAETHRGLCK